MSKHPIRHPAYRILICTALLIGSALLPPTIHGEETDADPPPSLPLLVKARRGDTPASIARRYLNDASKGWMIAEYNGMAAFSGGEPVLVPMAPFRPGGLTPDGYQTVPVLAYSDIGESSGQRRQVPRSAFDRQMRWLKTEGFVAITPSQLTDFMGFSGQLPRRSVLITFDTASLSLFEIGIPILKELGFTATVFAATNHVGDKKAMTWDQIKQLHRDGFTIGCRGRSGRSLTHRTKGQTFEDYFKSVEAELRLARQTIQTHLDAPCLFLAYPQGDADSLVSAVAAKLGFSAAFLLRPGDNPFFADRYGIHRTRIGRGMNMERFGQSLTTRIKADLN
ncbi:MAG: polysaccharide deacetylase family protein [Deltaproteobacteria bacterium]|nr:polysaccharide deacetylase family protein [Deltaproteobacteria bacterium]